MYPRQAVSRRSFVGGVAGALGYLGINPSRELWAKEVANTPWWEDQQAQDYDAMAKLANNENPWGPSDAVHQAIDAVWKYAGRYGYPDPGVQQAIADHHQLKAENVLLGAGSSETLIVMGQTFLQPGKKIIGAMPTYMSVYNYATGLGAEAITAPLLADGRQDIEQMVRLAKRNYRDVGFFYLVNPNNPTGVVVTKDEVKYVMDNLPEDVPILLDEAYHHFVDDPRYETGMQYVRDGRNVVIARTFSKIYGLAGIRLGYGVGPTYLVDRMRKTTTGMSNLSALAKYAAVASLKDTASEQRVRTTIIAQRKKTIGELQALGFKVLPSVANFFMVQLPRAVTAQDRTEFRNRGVLVGREFPPMVDYLRVSVGTAEEMDRFMTAFKQVYATTARTGAGGR
jgi:histidinol-phosphate aminotransferase